MSSVRYTPDQIAGFNKQAESQKEQVIRLQARFESHQQQYQQLVNQAKTQFKVNSLDELRALHDKEQSEINRAVENLVNNITARQAVLDELQKQLSDVQDGVLNA